MRILSFKMVVFFGAIAGGIYYYGDTQITKELVAARQTFAKVEAEATHKDGVAKKLERLVEGLEQSQGTGANYPDFRFDAETQAYEFDAIIDGLLREKLGELGIGIVSIQRMDNEKGRSNTSELTPIPTSVATRSFYHIRGTASYGQLVAFMDIINKGAPIAITAVEINEGKFDLYITVWRIAG